MPEPAPFLVLLPVLHEIPHPCLTRLNASRDLHEIDQRMGEPRHLWIFAISRLRLDLLCRPPVVNGNGPAFDGRQWSPHFIRDDDFHELNAINPSIAHPCVRIHNESGVKALYVSERTSHFDGMSRAESVPIIRYLCDHATRPENVYRHQWRVGDLVCWDNRTAMHLALGDFDPAEPRHMLRTTVQGEKSGYVVTAPSA